MTKFDESILYCHEEADDETWMEPGSVQDDYELVSEVAPPEVDPGYLCAEIRPKMRSILFDWMQQVCQEYALCRETFHLATTYVDRYLSCRPEITPTKLQLVGVTALVLAAKLEEVHQPTVDEFAATCAGCCTVCEILAMEKDMISALGWTLRYSSAPAWAASYLQRSIACHFMDNVVRKELLNADHFMRLMEIIDYSRLFAESLQYAPSTLAAAALFYVYSSWSPKIEHAITIKFADVEPCMRWISNVAGQLPFIGLRPILRGCRGEPYHLYSRQVYHPMALQMCLNSCP